MTKYKKIISFMTTLFLLLSTCTQAFADSYSVTIGNSNGYSSPSYISGGGSVGNLPGAEGYSVSILEDKWDSGLKYYIDQGKDLTSIYTEGYSRQFPGDNASYYWRTFFLFDDARASAISSLKEYQHGEKFDVSSSRVTNLPGQQSGYVWHPIESQLIAAMKDPTKGFNYIKKHWNDEFSIGYSNSTWMWNYILRGPNQTPEKGTASDGIKLRLRQQLNADKGDVIVASSGNSDRDSTNSNTITDDGYTCIADYLELMIALHNATSDGGNKSAYAWSIDALCDGWAGGSSDINKYPPAFEIEPICFSSGGDGNIGMCGVDYWEMMSGTTASNNARSKTVGSYLDENGNSIPYYGYDSFGLISTAATNAVYEEPNRDRMTNTFDTGNQYQMAERGNFGRRLRTNDSGAYTNQWQGDDKKFEGLTLGGNMYGSFMAITYGAIPSVKGTGRQDIEADKPAEEVLPCMQDVIGKDVSITLETKQSDEVIQDWESSKYDTSSGVNVPYTYEFSYDVQTKYTSDKRAASSMSSLGNPVCTESDYLNNAGTGNWVGKNISYDELMQFFKGDKQLTLTHKTMSQGIANEETIRFDYTSRVCIRKIKADGSIYIPTKGSDSQGYITLTPNDGIAYKQFYRNKLTPYYRSTPEAYSEIKADSPEKEKWEAMAGVPTTEQLYFASGGSEFIVDMEMEYHKETVNRNYSYSVAYSYEVEHSSTSTHTNDDGSTSTHTTYWYTTEHSTYTDSWKQPITIEYMKMKNCKVWQIKYSKVKGMNDLVAVHESDNKEVLTAEDKGSDPTYYFHVASSDSSSGDRLRYTFETKSGDSVSDSYGSEVSGLSSAKSKVSSYKSGNSNTAYVESDSLILQTTSGDQIAYYYDSQTNNGNLDSQLSTPIVGEAGMWYNNIKTSASNWKPTSISKGSYNGDYSNPSSCFTPTGNYSEFNGMTFSGETMLEHFYTKYNMGNSSLLRPDRPNDRLMLWKPFNSKLTYQNGKYNPGVSDIFYENVVKYPITATSTYDSTYSPTKSGVNSYGTTDGIIVPSTYSKNHKTINSIVIHDPVSAEYSKVISLPKERDQRVLSKDQLQLSQNIINNYNSTMQSTEYITNPDYHNNLLFNPGAEIKSSLTDTPLGWSISKPNDNTLTLTRSIYDVISNSLADNSGNNLTSNASFKISASNASQGTFYQDIDVVPGNTYKLTGDIVSQDNSMNGMLVVYFKGYCNLDGTKTDGYINDAYAATKYIHKDSKQVSMDITIPAGVSKISVGLAAIATGAGNVLFDNIILTNSTTSGFIPNTRTVYDTKEVVNPNYHKHAADATMTKVYYGLNEPNVDSNGNGVIDSDDMHVDIPGYQPYKEVWSDGLVDNSYEHFLDKIQDFKYTGQSQIFIAPETGDYTFACRGANGGDSLGKDTNGDYLKGGKGSSFYGTYNLEKGSAVYINVGGKGNNATDILSDVSTYTNLVNVGVDSDGGYNGGANSTIYTGSGGGATDVRLGLLSLSDTTDRRLIVSGGGAGATMSNNGSDAGNDLDVTHQLYKGDMPLQLNQSGGGGGYRGGHNSEGGSNLVANGASHTFVNMNKRQDTDGSLINDTIDTSDISKLLPTETTSGNGIVRIYFSSTIPVEKPTIQVSAASEYQYDNTVPDSARIKLTDKSGKLQINNEQSTFINLDYGFQIYFPNVGDFYQNNKHGISECTTDRSAPSSSSSSGGYIDNMDTTLWTKQKYVIFPVNVLYNSKMYISGEKIYLPVNEEYFDFYCVLANYEKAKAKVQFVPLAINNTNYSIQTESNGDSPIWSGDQEGDDFKPKITGTGNLDNKYPINKIRTTSTLAAKHSAVKEYYIDVVGRIGDYMIQDVGDPRAATIFKKANPTSSGWLIDNIIPTVDESKQNKIIGQSSDIRDISTGDDNTNSMNDWMFDYNKFSSGSYSSGKTFDTTSVLGKASNTNNYHLDTRNIHGDFANQTPYNFPLSPTYSSIDALKKQPLRLGYPVYQDLQTIGNYATGYVQILPYYYYYNFSDNSIIPVDIYMKENNNYVPINLFGKANQVTTNKTSESVSNNTWLYNNYQYLDWQNENVRRNTPLSSVEWKDTISVAKQIQSSSVDGTIDYNSNGVDPVYVDVPNGMYYSFGNNQIMKLTGRCRTFTGSTYVYGNYVNNGERIDPSVYMVQGQRWHFTNTLPSTSILVQKGKKVTTNNIMEMKNENGVLLAGLDIKAVGNVWTLQNDAGGNNTTFNFDGNNYPIPKDIVKQRVYTIMSTSKSSADDMDVSGTH